MQPAKNKVLMIGWEYPPQNSGGLGVACEGLSKSLALQNTEIYFTLPFSLRQKLDHMKVVSCFDPDWQGKKDMPPFQAYSTAVKLISRDEIDSHKLRALPQSEIEKKVQRYADLVGQKAARMKDEFEVIHAHDWMSFPAGIKLKKKTGIPLVAHVHSTEEDRIPTGTGSQYIKYTEKRGMEAADIIVAVSFYTKQLLINKYGINPDKIEVVHNGVSPLSYEPDPGSHHFALKRPVIAFMGRLTMQKGAEFFIEVSQKVMKKIPHALFVLAGSGDMYHELLLRTAQQNLTASVLFSGFVRGTQKRKLLERADVFMMPSVSEPFGLVALEAAQHHAPVIVSKNSGASEIMKGSIKLDFWDTDKMAHKILELLTNQGYRQQTIRRQLSDLEDATWDNSALKIRSVYRKAFIG